MKHRRLKTILVFLITPCFLANAPAPRPDYEDNYDGIVVSDIELIKQEGNNYSYIATFKNEGDKFVEPREDIYLEGEDGYRYYFDVHSFQIIAPQSEVTISLDLGMYADHTIEVIPENFVFRSLVANGSAFNDFTVKDIEVIQYEGNEYNDSRSYVSFSTEFNAKKDTYGYMVNIDYDGEDRYYLIRYGTSGDGEHHLSFECEYDFDISKMEVKSLTPLGYSHHYHPRPLNWINPLIIILVIGFAEIVVGGIVAICIVKHVKKKKRLKAQSQK